MNPAQDCLALFLTKFFKQPLFGGVGCLAIVAAADAVTEGNNIGGNRAGAIKAANWNPVIHRERVKQSAWAQYSCRFLLLFLGSWMWADHRTDRSAR